MSDESQRDAEKDPGAASVQKYLLYTLSIPERALRSGAGMVSGAVRESAGLLVPRAFQNSKTYSVMVRQMLDYLAEDVGGVKRAQAAEAPPAVENFVARKAVGNFVELAGMATIHISPLTVLAVLSDVAYGSQTLLREWGAELKKQGIIDENSTIDRADDLLAAISKASSVSASAFDTPPLSVDGLKQTIDETRAAVNEIDPTLILPQAEIQRMWQDMRSLADREGVSLTELSTAVTLGSLNKVADVGRGALSGVKVAGNMFDRHILDHYRTSIAEIQAKGIYASLAESAAPYIEAVWNNFAAEKGTITEDLLNGKLAGKAWSGVRRWLGVGSQDKLSDDSAVV